MRLTTCLILLTCYYVEVFSWVCKHDSYPWKPDGPGKDREDLVCDSRCKLLGVEEGDCCRCYNCATWAGTEVDLFVEFVTVLGKSIVLSEESYNESKIYKVEHTDSDLTDLPSNICNWDNDSFIHSLYEEIYDNMQVFWTSVVKLDFQNNRIRRLQDINCLTKLDEVNLNGNKLTYVSNHSFANLRYLRTINFRNNQIKTIDPATTSAPTLNVLRVDFSYNLMTEIDVTNMLSLYGFCRLDFSHNLISHAINELQQALNLSRKYGPGFTSLRNNKIEKIPNFKELFHLEKLFQLGKLIEFGFDYRDNPIHCDCAFQPILSLSEQILLVILRDYHQVYCQSPPDLNGTAIKNVDLDRLICQLPASAGCQKPECLCIDKPNDGYLYVDCSNSDLAKIPDVPYSEYSTNIHLNISDNRISTIRNVSYLPSIDVIDLSKNDIAEINPEVARYLENASIIDISDNLRIKSLPSEFQRRDVCKTFMRNLVIRCDCDSRWIQTWVHSKTCNNSYTFFTCDVPGHGLMPALSFNAEDLNCFSGTNYLLLAAWIIGLLIALISMSIIAYYFRYEILILYLRIRKLKFNQVVPKYKYDVFISFNDNDDSVRMWVVKILLVCLERENYSVFLPTRDLPYGGDRDKEVNAAILNSRNALIVLSDSYTEQREDGIRPWTENEWKYSWNNFKKFGCKKIVLVNFDHASASDVDYPQIKAFLRVGCTVCFKNYKRCIIEEIRTKLGPPFRRPEQELPEKGLRNKKTKPSLIDLFVVPAVDKDKVWYQDTETDEGLFQTKDIILYTRVRRDDNDNKQHPIKHVMARPKCQYRKCYACQQLHDHTH